MGKKFRGEKNPWHLHKRLFRTNGSGRPEQIYSAMMAAEVIIDDVSSVFVAKIPFGEQIDKQTLRNRAIGIALHEAVRQRFKTEEFPYGINFASDVYK